VYTLFVPPPPLPPITSTPWFQVEPVPPSSPILLKRNTGDNKKDISFLLVWDKDSYTERFLGLLPCTCVLQLTLVHFYQTSSLLPGLLPTVASASLRLLYSLLNREHINHTQVLGFLSFPYFSVRVLPLVCDPCPIILLHLVCVYKNMCMRENVNFGLLSLANFA
jgi:hypothetical protein